MKVESNHIVCGRGQSNYNNEGNRIFRQVVARRLPLYMDENTGRSAKTKLVNETTRKLLQMKLVFVTRSSADRHWVKLNTDRARTKVAHLFRDASRQARLSRATKSNSSSAVLIPSASDSDDSSSHSSLFSSAVDTGLATHSDSHLNNMVSSSVTKSDSQVQETKGVDSASSIAEMGARSNDHFSSEKPKVPKVINCEGSVYMFPHTLSKIEFSDAIENTLNELRIRASSTHNWLMQSQINQGLETWETLDHNDVCSLSNVEHLDDLHSLTADFRDFESNLDLFMAESMF